MQPIQTGIPPIKPLVPSGWAGGFEATKPDSFPYPEADLTSLQLLDNLTYVRNLQRQQKAYWPEFTWLTDPTADPNGAYNRCYEMFSPDVSRLGYDDTGRVWAIICPQQGVWVDNIVCLNIEVSVFSQRGWVDEPTKQFAADMTVGAQVWFSPSTTDRGIYDFLSTAAAATGHAFPLSKQHAIQIDLLSPEFPPLPYLKVRDGLAPGINYPEWVTHYNEPAFWSTAHVQVKIGDIKQTTDAVVNEFNQLVMNAFNIASDNLLQPNNMLTWNLWVGTPERVERNEWANHAATWRASIDSEAKEAPTGPGRAPCFADKTPLVPETEAFKDVCDWLCTKLGMPQTYCTGS